MSKMKSVQYIHLETVHSTNSWVKEHNNSLNPEGVTCVFATEQTAGRGRFNRPWCSAKGNNIYATLYFCCPTEFPYINNLSQILSLAAIEVLEQKGFHPQIKWPNDILIEEKKLAGILCETFSLDKKIGIALGIGINVDISQSLLDIIDQPATSLAQFSDQIWEREQLLHPIVEQFLKHFTQLQEEGFGPFVPTYTKLLSLKHRPITYHEGTRRVEGMYESINQKGELVLSLADGKLVTLLSGEIK